MHNILLFEANFSIEVNNS